MPWNVSMVSRHTKLAKTNSEKRQWVKVANGARDACLKEGGTEEYCDAKAIRIANAHIRKMKNTESKWGKLNIAVAPINIMEAEKEKGERRIIIRVLQGDDGEENDGISLNNNYYSKEVAESIAVLLQDSKNMYIDHIDRDKLQEMTPYLGAGRPLKDLAGIIEETWAENAATYAKVHLPDKPETGWLYEVLREHPDAVGVSIDAMAFSKEGKIRDREVNIIEKIDYVEEVDFVGKPAAGGNFIAMAECVQEGVIRQLNEEEIVDDSYIDKTIEILKNYDQSDPVVRVIMDLLNNANDRTKDTIEGIIKFLSYNNIDELIENIIQFLKKDEIVENITQILEEIKTTTQSLILSKEVFPTKEKANKWVKDHNKKIPSGGARETENSWRYEQVPKGHFIPESFRTIELTKGVKAVIGHLKKQYRKKESLNLKQNNIGEDNMENEEIRNLTLEQINASGNKLVATLRASLKEELIKEMEEDGKIKELEERNKELEEKNKEFEEKNKELVENEAKREAKMKAQERKAFISAEVKRLEIPESCITERVQEVLEEMEGDEKVTGFLEDIAKAVKETTISVDNPGNDKDSDEDKGKDNNENNEKKIEEALNPENFTGPYIRYIDSEQFARDMKAR